MPLVSVLMTMRNASSTVAAAVSSTLRALPADAELVVHDDASKDSSLAIVERMRDPRLRVVHSSKQRGVTPAINMLLDAVDCRFVARMDADDICLPWRFSIQLPRLREACDVTFGQMVNFGQKLRQFRPMAPIRVSPEAMPFHLVIANLLPQPAMIAELEVVRTAGGYRAETAEDYELWMRLVVEGARLERLAVPTILRRLHPEQMTATLDWRNRPALDSVGEKSYRELCQAILGQEPTWYPNPRRNAQPASALVAMREAIHSKSREMPVVERAYLLTRLRNTLRHAAPYPGESGPP